MVIGALAFVAMLGIAGLAVDGGRAELNRRSLQAAADTAADSAMRMMLQDYHDAVLGNSQTFTDKQICQEINKLSSASDASSSSSGIDSTVFHYSRPDGTWAAGVGYATQLKAAPPGNNTSTPSCSNNTALNLCTDSSQTDCVAGLLATPQYQQSTYVLGALGVTSSTQKATATSVFKLSGPTIGGLGPWPIWYYQCNSGTTTFNGQPAQMDADDGDTTSPASESDNDGVTEAAGSDATAPGDIMTIDDPSWSSTDAGCKNAPDGTGPAAIKGDLNWDSTTQTVTTCAGAQESTVSIGDCLTAKPGVAAGQQPTGILDQGLTIFPVIDYANKQGSNIQTHVVGFVVGHKDPTFGGPHSFPIKIDYVCLAGSTSTHCVLPPGTVVVQSGFLK